MFAADYIAENRVVLLVKNTNKGGAAKKLNRRPPFGSCLFGKMKDESDDEK
jgi:hypothetical protein